MKTMSFSLASNLDEKLQEAALERLRAVHGVEAVGRVNPGSKSKTISRMCVARVADDAPVDDLKREIADAAGVDVTDVQEEAPRYPQ